MKKEVNKIRTNQCQPIQTDCDIKERAGSMGIYSMWQAKGSHRIVPFGN